jgi:hypothetical protein
VKERYNCEDKSVYRRIALNRIFRKEEGRVWSGFVWLRLETGRGLL